MPRKHSQITHDAETWTLSFDLAHLEAHLRIAAASGFNGIVRIAQGDRLLLHRAYGWADAAQSRPLTPDTPFWIASISKTFAAAAVLKLAELGRLSLKDPLTRFFHAVPHDKASITLHHLLSHTAGLGQHYAADGVTDREDAVMAILSQPLQGPPGSGFSYSNDAYTLVAAIIELVAEMPYESYLCTTLLEPAGLTHSGFWGSPESASVAPILPPLTRPPSVLRPNWGYRGATGMYATAEDLHRWYRALQSNRILSVESWHRMITPYVTRPDGTGVGYGWFISHTPQGAVRLWTRGYEDFGHGAVLTVHPDQDLVLIVMSNSGADATGMPVSHTLAEHLNELICAHDAI